MNNYNLTMKKIQILKVQSQVEDQVYFLNLLKYQKYKNCLKNSVALLMGLQLF